MANEVEILIKARNLAGGDIAAVKAQLKSLAGDTHVEVKVDLDDASVKAELGRLGAKDLHIKAKVDVDDASVKAELDRLSATDLRVKVKIDVDKTGVPGLGDGKDQGLNWGKAFSTGIGDALSSIPVIGDRLSQAFTAAGPEVQAAVGATLVGAVAASLPLIGAVTAGAVASGALFGVLGLGVVASLSNPEVKAAATGMMATIGDTVKSASQPLWAPLTSAFAQVGQAVKADGPLLTSMFANAAPAVKNLATGVAGFVNNLLPGLNGALKNSGALSEAWAHGMSGAGAAIGSAIDKMANSKGTIDGINTAFSAINFAVKATGTTVTVLADSFHGLNLAAHYVSDAYEGFVHLGGAAKGVGTAIVSAIDPMAGAVIRLAGLGQGADGAARSTGRLAGIAKTAGVDILAGAVPIAGVVISLARMGQQADSAAKAETALAAATLKATEASWKQQEAGAVVADGNVKAAQDLNALTDSVKANGKALDMNSAAGLNNRAAIANAANDILGLRDAETASGWAATDVTNKFNSQASTLVDTTAKAFGITRKAAIAMVATYLGIPKQVLTKIVADNAAAAAKAAQIKSLYAQIPRSISSTFSAQTNAALQNIKTLQAYVNALHGKSISVDVYQSLHGSLGPLQYSHGATGGVPGMASGGISGMAAGGVGMGFAGLGGGRKTLVGEQGPELVNLPFGSSVTPAGGTAAALAAGGGGSNDITIYLQLDDAGLLKANRRVVKSNGGNVQAVYGRGK